MEPAHEFPVSAAHDIESDDDMSDDANSSDDDAMEDIAMYEEPRPPNGTPPGVGGSPLERFPSATLSPAPPTLSASPLASPTLTSTQLTMVPSRQSTSESSATRPRSSASRRSSARGSMVIETPPSGPVLGERLKLRFLETNIVSTLLVRPTFFPQPLCRSRQADSDLDAFVVFSGPVL